MKCSSIIESLPASGIRKVFDRVAAIEKGGEKVIRLDVGLPDFATPPFIVEAAKRALDDGLTKYTGNRGLPELLQALSRDLQARKAVRYDPETEIIVTCGASEAVAVAMLGVLEPGSEVLVPEPLWPHYVCCARMAGATPVAVPLSVRDGFLLSRELLERYVTARTRMLVLNSPQNPTGVVYPRPVLDDLLAFAQRHGLYVLADEIYDDFFYDQPPPSFAALAGAREHAILVGGFSKNFGMTGWRLGYLAAPAKLCVQLLKPHQYLTICAGTFVQKAAVAALTHPHAQPFLAGVRAEFRRRRDALLEIVSDSCPMQYAYPAGAFYFFPSLAGQNRSSLEVASQLLEEARVSVVPGSVFGASCDAHIRLSYGSCAEADLREGLRRIIAVLRNGAH